MQIWCILIMSRLHLEQPGKKCVFFKQTNQLITFLSMYRVLTHESRPSFILIYYFKPKQKRMSPFKRKSINLPTMYKICGKFSLVEYLRSVILFKKGIFKIHLTKFLFYQIIQIFGLLQEHRFCSRVSHRRSRDFSIFVNHWYFRWLLKLEK